ncbi:RDD family protein [Sansalvadorimonas verongulae]|uniref:RDD family protein n=1 Tax=Sansalvadorimonas verongulae TaxID=2172824 RepID=UPI0012BC54CD|nr:RDD family protein [Sansalvadorimonas verongulae]MTI12443.1 RDD family protein [Sansalvadorimonas verongulae]
MSQKSIDLQPAPLWRRLAAMFYDTMLVLAMVMVISGLYHAIVHNWLLGLESAPTGFNPLLSTILLFVMFFFFAHFWGKNGQTLGMQAWRLRVRSTKTGRNLTLIQSLLRFIVAIPALGLAGLGVFWIVIDKKKRTWYDRYSESEVVLIPKKGD